jgi:TRAP-type C4-dicarboxylate transport system permease large subunit
MFLILGMIMELSLALILFGPIVAPVAYAAGLEPLQLGVMLLVNVAVRLATPPVGNALFPIASVVTVDMSKPIKELLPFLAIKFAVMSLIGVLAFITLFVPQMFGMN